MADKNDRKAAKAGIWYTIVNYISKGAIFFTTPFFTRMMTKEEIGAFANISTWVSVLLPLATFDMGVTLAIARFDYKNEFDRYCSSAMTYGSMIGAALYLIAILFMPFFSQLLSLEPFAIHLMFIYMITYPALSFFQSQNMYAYKYKTSAVITMTSLCLSIGLAMLLTGTMENRVAGRALGYFGVYIVFSLALYAYMLVKGRGISFKYFKYATKISFPMIWHTMSMHLLTSGDRIVIIKVLGESANAMYSIAYTCAHVVSVLYQSMNSAWSPWSTSQMDAGNTEKLRKMSRIYVLCFAVFVVLLILICPELLLIMGGRSYLESKMVIPPVMIAVVYQFVYSLYINAEFFLKKQKRIAVGTILAAVLNLVLNVIFVPRYGYVAAAYTTMVGYLFLFIFHFISLKLLGKSDWYDEKFNILVILAVTALLPAVNFLYRHDPVRYACLAAAALALAWYAWKRREDLMKVIRFFLKKEKKAEAEES